MKKAFLVKSKHIKNTKGDIIKYINVKSRYFKKFGEVYFSEIKKDKTKGWILHKKNTCIITVPYGVVEFKIRKKNEKKIRNFKLYKENDKLLIIPPNNWFCFKSLVKISLVANLIESVHSEQEVEKKII
jgi:hypothetical protein